MRAVPLPENALLKAYQRDGNYTDCFIKDVAAQVDLGSFLTVFYTTSLFRVERVILRFAAKRPSSDADVAALADATTTRFAAWNVEAREADQILLCDMGEATRSWFMVRPTDAGTRLYFGSAVVGSDHWAMRMLLPLHKLYARALLASVRF